MGRVAVVTGASSGVGRAIAMALVADDATVCLVGRDARRLADAEDDARQRGGRAFAHAADLARDDDVRGLATGVQKDLGGVDILVHAAGVIAIDPMESAALGDLDHQYRTNLRGPYALTQALLPTLRDRKAEVVFVNSTQGVTASGGSGQYAATKHGLRAVADSLRAEVNAAGVRVLTVLLGQTATPMQKTLYEAQGRHYRPELLVQPEDVARTVVAALSLPRTAEVTEVTIRPFHPPREGG